MKWNPLNAISSSLQPRLHISDYKKDFKFDFFKGQLDLNESVEGFKAFEQKFIKVLLTNETPAINYGLFGLLPTSNAQAEFESQCKKLAYAIVSHQFSDSTPESLNGLGYTVEKIHSVSKESINDTNYIFVEMSVAGSKEKIVIKIPLRLVEENMQ